MIRLPSTNTLQTYHFRLYPNITILTGQYFFQAMLNKSADVTLNMLNAPESEVDVEGLHEDVKLEFDGATEEVTS